MTGASRWTNTDAPRGDAYDERWQRLAASGADVHGEATLVEQLVREHLDPGRHAILDAGCGTGRVAIELAARGFDVIGVDLDPGMLTAARGKAPELRWETGDLATFDLGCTVAAIVLAGNVMIFVAPGTEGPVLHRLAAHLEAAGEGSGGLLIAGFQVRADRLALDDYDRLANDAGLVLLDRYATWDREPYRGGDYAVSVHRRT